MKLCVSQYNICVRAASIKTKNCVFVDRSPQLNIDPWASMRSEFGSAENTPPPRNISRLVFNSRTRPATFCFTLPPPVNYVISFTVHNKKEKNFEKQLDCSLIALRRARADEDEDVSTQRNPF